MRRKIWVSSCTAVPWSVQKLAIYYQTRSSFWTASNVSRMMGALRSSDGSVALSTCVMTMKKTMKIITKCSRTVRGAGTRQRRNQACLFFLNPMDSPALWPCPLLGLGVLPLLFAFFQWWLAVLHKQAPRPQVIHLPKFAGTHHAREAHWFMKWRPKILLQLW